MQRSLMSLCLVALGASFCVFASRSAVSGQGTAMVRLQTTSPGSTQVGNANVSGTVKAGQFEGVGTGLTNVNAEALGGFPPTSFGRVSTTNVWTGGNTFSNAGNSFIGNGSGLSSVNADLLDGLNSTAFLQSIPVPLSLSGSNGITGIIRGSNSSNGSNAVAVRGTASAISGQTYAGYFDNVSVAGTGLHAQSQGPLGIEGISSITSGVATGGYFEAASPSGIGAMGNSIAPTGSTLGVWGQAISANGIGVKGENSNLTSGVGVFGLAGTRLSGALTSLVGVFGEANGMGSVGVHGFNSNEGTGVLGRSSGANGAGIVGQGVGGARAGFFLGEVEVAGRIVKDYGASSHEAVPIAYGTVASAGTFADGSSNWTSVWNAGTSSYEITLTGYSYSNNLTTVVTPIANAVPRIGGVAPVGTKLGVTFFTTAGAKVQVAFHFVVYSP